MIDNKDKEISPDWVTNLIMSDHPDVTGKDADFHLCCSRLTVRKEVTQQINKIDKDKPGVTQRVLDGFEHLQEYYVIDRKGEKLAVKIEECSDDELENKAVEYEAMAKTCMEHADEIRRYIRTRGIPIPPKQNHAQGVAWKAPD